MGSSKNSALMKVKIDIVFPKEDPYFPQASLIVPFDNMSSVATLIREGAHLYDSENKDNPTVDGRLRCIFRQLDMFDVEYRIVHIIPTTIKV